MAYACVIEPGDDSSIDKPDPPITVNQKFVIKGANIDRTNTSSLIDLPREIRAIKIDITGAKPMNHAQKNNVHERNQA